MIPTWKTLFIIFKKYTMVTIGKNEDKNASCQQIFWFGLTRVKNSLPRTTNAIETWHSTLNKRGGIKRQHKAKFICLLQTE